MGSERFSTNSIRLATGDCVLLVHGLGANRLIMRPLQKRFERQAIDTVNWRYPSTRSSIRVHAERLLELLEHLTSAQTTRLGTNHRLHLVTHSMGCIVMRAALAQRTVPCLGRWVMLAPPNRGSHVARILAHWLGRMVPPLIELSDQPQSFVNELPPFAALNPVPFAVIEAKRDRVIASESVRLTGQLDHAVVDCHHGLLPWHTETGQLVERFLRTGTFTDRALCCENAL